MIHVLHKLLVAVLDCEKVDVFLSGVFSFQYGDGETRLKKWKSGQRIPPDV